MECLICNSNVDVSGGACAADAMCEPCYALCDRCRADAELGRAVRAMNPGRSLCKTLSNFGEKQVWCYHTSGTCPEAWHDTPEQALKGGK